jgi:RimJ/RimL family protein N-acetyltransferase
MFGHTLMVEGVNTKLPPVALPSLETTFPLYLGNAFRLRLVTVADAAYILTLRTDARKTQYIPRLTGDLAGQQAWLSAYKLREAQQQEFYCIIESKLALGSADEVCADWQAVGIVRLYDFKYTPAKLASFCWGSWILGDNAPFDAALKTTLTLYRFAFTTLGFQQAHFEVRKGNAKVLAFHLKTGAVKVGEDEQDIFFTYSPDAFNHWQQKYARYSGSEK